MCESKIQFLLLRCLQLYVFIPIVIFPKARLHALQLDVETYTQPPRGSLEQFSMWKESFDIDSHKGDISELLVSKVEVRALYTKLVSD